MRARARENPRPQGHVEIEDRGVQVASQNSAAKKKKKKAHLTQPRNLATRTPPAFLVFHTPRTQQE